MARKLIVEIAGDASRFARSMEQAQTHSRRLSGSLGVLSKAAAGAGLAIGTGLAIAAKVGFDEFTDHEKVAARTANVLKTTGQAANVTAKHVEDLAGHLLKLSGVDDEAIQGAENLLLTFTKVRNEAGKGNAVFDRTTKAALDISAATGKSLNPVMIALGKALDDPITKTGALSRIGVQFTKDQKEQIKTLAEHGKTLEAQKIILGQVEERYQGAAKAAGQTFGGQVNIAKEQLKNFAGDAVGVALPALAALLTKINDVVPRLVAMGEKLLQNVRPAIDAVVNIIQKDFVPIWEKLRQVAVDTINKISDVLEAHGPELRKIFNNLGEAIRNIGEVIMPILKFALVEVLPRAIAVAIPILVKITEVIADVSKAIRVIAETVGTVFDALPKKLGGIKDQLFGVFSGIGGALAAALKAPINAVIDAWNSIHLHIGGVKVLGKQIIPDIDISTPNIPHLASGGIVTKPTLALIGERGPEAVLPLKSGRMPMTVTVNVSGFVGNDQDIARRVRVEMEKMQRRGINLGFA